jgi:hypothetical protein
MQAADLVEMMLTMPTVVDRRFEAIVFDWHEVPAHDADASEVRSLVESLCSAGMDMVVVAGEADVRDVDDQLQARPSGPGRLYVCLNGASDAFVVDASGPRLVTGDAEHAEIDVTDRSGSVRWALSMLKRSGIAASQILVVGEGLGSYGRDLSRFAELLRDQLDRRVRGEPPVIDDDPAWTLTA